MNEQPIAHEGAETPEVTEKPVSKFEEITAKLLGFYNYSIVATLVGLAVSMLGICFSVFWPLPQVSVYCLLIAGAIHLMDGKIAKTKMLTPEEAGFGRTLDLISDFSAFVLLPLAIGFASGMETAWFLPFLLIYLLAGLIRLCYLFVTDAERKETGGRHRQVHIGLPVGSVSLILPLFYLLRGAMPLVFPWLLGLLMLALSFGFLWRFKMNKVGIKGMMVYLLIGIVEMVLLAILA
ncbi:MAG: hypothetical protein IJC17_01190 [Clostridia bacterium]|nr:hypothetical protein [Clostridia bacterium]